DMVGHTGNLQAGIQACEVVDLQVGKIVDAVLKTKATLIITADHGNIEEMIDNETGEIDTAHSTYPVPCIFVAKKLENQAIELEPGILADLAPTMISLLGLGKPEEMTGRALIKVE
ncbi:MAG: sulfatase-like hydrolase/transferase, partial [Candidatus Pacebacteria bacterium]|nr:sulfatase-like hydrolase/transferase [Candidatus Paceibacterota bacterium]